MGLLQKIFGRKESENKQEIHSYADFWNWFQQHEKEFYQVMKNSGDIEEVFFNKLSPMLIQLHDGILFLTGMSDENTAELVITVDGEIKNVAFAEAIVKSAPQIPGWIFTALKPATPDISMKMNGYDFKVENMSFVGNNVEGYPDEIEITVIHDDLTTDNLNEIGTGIFIFLENYIGEENFIVNIDNILIKRKDEVEADLIPLDKLPSYLDWRQKEFIEKYEGLRHDTESDNYSVMEAKAKKGPLLAVLNVDLLNWDSKASHPWIMDVEILYPEWNNGMPDNAISELMNQIEDDINSQLKDADGYLNVGRQTYNNQRDIYFACKDFRLPSLVLDKIVKKYQNKIKIDFNIYKDKYWRSLERFSPHN